MAADLINFDVIEDQKENIQSIPGGRSAKQLAGLSFDSSARDSVSLTQSQELKNRIRKDFEEELLTVDETDDPLEVFDRYIKWTMDAYPSVQPTPESGLLRLLEGATNKFVSSQAYKNDPRYLKLWLNYIKFFSDAPQETYGFLARNGIGANLALFYEEYAAWLELNGRWAQAAQVFQQGLNQDARPTKRLATRYDQFTIRRQAKGTDTEGPDSPALPQIRPALIAKSDGPETSVMGQLTAQNVRSAASITSNKPARAKMTIFSDNDNGSGSNTAPGLGQGTSWDGLGSLSERRKENTREPSSWVGQTLDGGRKTGESKIMVFKDELSKLASNPHDQTSNTHHDIQRTTIDAKGRQQYVFAHLEAVYPHGVGGAAVEYCFEELRAVHRGWLDSTFRSINHATSLDQITSDASSHLNLLGSQPDLPAIKPIHHISSSNKPLIPDTVTVPLKECSSTSITNAVKKDDRVNRTRKIKILSVEVKQETQTVQLNLNSPSRPTKVKKKKPESTVTIHTKEAINEVYDIFNRTTEEIADGEITDDEIEDNEDDEDDEDDYTSVGESTGTGHISTNLSEYGDETTGDFSTSSRINDHTSSTTQDTSADSDFSEYQGNDTIETLNVTSDADEAEDLSQVHIDALEAHEGSSDTGENTSLAEQYAVPSSDHTPVEGDINVSSIHSTGYQHNPSYRATKTSMRLPFMTPIVEKTESSIGALTTHQDKSTDSVKTPSRQTSNYLASIENFNDNYPLPSPEPNSFHEAIEQARKIPPPALIKSHAETERLHSHPDFIKVNPSEQECQNSGVNPLVIDKQCNPMDPGVRLTILNSLEPSIASYQGYCEYKGQVSKDGDELQKIFRAFSKRGNTGEIASQLPALHFAGCDRRYTVRRELGRGAFAPVYLVGVASLHLEQGCQSPQLIKDEVVKLEQPANCWEFYMIREAHHRLKESRAVQSLVKARSFYMFDNESFLMEEYRSQGTLLEAINIIRNEGNGAMDENLALFFSIEVLRTVEALHIKNLIHGDLKPDNVLIRLDRLHDIDWSGQYRKDGSEGWDTKGILLIDFGRAIDMRAFRNDVQFIADWQASDADCTEMREMRPWTYQVDYYGIAGILHSLLFGKYMETTVDHGSNLIQGSTKTYKIKEGYKRYWQTEVWCECFSTLLNSTRHAQYEENEQLPLRIGLKQLRERMELALEANCEKGLGLRASIRRLDASLRERKR